MKYIYEIVQIRQEIFNLQKSWTKREKKGRKRDALSVN
jgi:hypothetical protein